MRQGYNPNKDQVLEKNSYRHQVIIPVYIPKTNGYFKDSLAILKICLESIAKTSHDDTLISVVDNGSCTEVSNFLYELKDQKKIQELIITSNIGKINAALKAASGHDMPLVTIADADILFDTGWQNETVRIFNHLPKAGVVGLIPQFLSYQYNSENLLFNNFFNKNLKFEQVKDPEAMVAFYDSIGWDRTYPQARLNNILCFNSRTVRGCIGTGHAVSTYRRDILEKVDFKSAYKMGGDSEASLDQLPARLGYYSYTTYNNYARHMGNTLEDWMLKKRSEEEINSEKLYLPQPPKKPAFLLWNLKKKLISSVFKRHKLRMIYIGYKGLSKENRKAF